jgi:hypothetical protein
MYESITWIESCSICKSVHLNSGGPIREVNVLTVFVSWVDNNTTVIMGLCERKEVL